MKKQSGQMRYYYRRRAYGIELLGGKCAQCGATENLEFDHIVKADKAFSIGKGYSKSLDDLKKELEKCQLLCNPCHKKKNETDNGKSEHGNYSMYKNHGCRCALCTEENNRRSRIYKETYRNKHKRSTTQQVVASGPSPH